MKDYIKDEGNVLESLNSHEAVPTYWIERAAETLISVYPDPDNPDTWNVCEAINPHAIVCIEHCQKNNVATDNTLSLYISIGIYETRHGSYESASMRFKNALVAGEELFGVDHINTAYTINNLGLTYNSQGKYDKAIAQYERALRIYEKAFGVDHINTADTNQQPWKHILQSGQVR